MRKNLIRGLAFGAVLAAGGSAAIAQPAPPPAERAGVDRPDPAERTQQHAQRLRDVLQLRPNQEAALAELTAAMKPPEGARERMRAERGEMAKLTTPERLDRMHERMMRRQQAFDRRAMAIKKFYAQLTPAQQKAFDAMGPMMGHGGGKMGHGRMGGGRGGWTPDGHGPDGHELGGRGPEGHGPDGED